jgi:hypothetical protein
MRCARGRGRGESSGRARVPVGRFDARLL